MIPQAGCLLKVLGVDSRFLLATHGGDALVHLAQASGCGHALDTHTGTSLVDKVNGFVRQVAVVDVTVGEVGGRSQRAVGNGHAVVSLVAVTQTFKNIDGQLNGRLRYLHRLETTLQRSVLLNMLAVFIQRGGTDGLQFTAGQLGLEQ